MTRRDARRTPAIIAMAYDPLRGWYDWTAAVAAVVLGILDAATEHRPLTLGACSTYVWHAWIVFWLARMARYMAFRHRTEARCATAAELAEVNGADESEVARALEARGVAPRYVNAGVAYFDRTDVGDEALLLRPVEAPDGGALVRPVEDEAVLLRAADDDA